MSQHYELDVCIQTHDMNITPLIRTHDVLKWIRYAVIEIGNDATNEMKLKEIKCNGRTYQLRNCLCTRPKGLGQK